jgi:hypothetical protein
MVKPFRVSVRLVSWLVVLIWSAAAHGSAAEFRKVIESVSYVRVGASENNVYVVGPTSHPLLIDSHYDYDVKETIAAMENAGIKAGNASASSVIAGSLRAQHAQPGLPFVCPRAKLIQNVVQSHLSSPDERAFRVD